MTAARRRRTTPIERILSPFQRFAHTEASAGLVLLGATLVALALANSPWSDSYFHLWELRAAVSVAGHTLGHPVHGWINDGLMAVFFFLVGLEIKREVLYGELSGLRRALLPLAGAIGGMVVPAGLYLLANLGQPRTGGWAIPMATDIAFAIGVLTLLGKGMPTSARIFLTALAIADDIGAVLVIALLFTSQIDPTALVVALAFLLLLAGMNVAGVRRPGAYAAVGALLWLAVLESGLHATIAGILAAGTVPARTRIDAGEFIDRGRALLASFSESAARGVDVLTSSDQQETLRRLQAAGDQAQAPLHRIENALHGWVAFAIIPIFAFANAGVDLRDSSLGALLQPVTLGIILGLVVGKPLGILLAARLSTSLGPRNLPDGLSWPNLLAVAPLGGIGFTMSLFIAALAFGEGPRMSEAKLGILAASALSALLGWVAIRLFRRQAEPDAAQDVDPGA